MEDNKNIQTNTPGGQRRGGRGGGRGGRGFGAPREKSEYDQKVLDIARVTRVTKGGKRFSFRITVVIGDGKSKVGVGIGKGVDIAQSMQKAFNRAKKNLIIVPIVNGTIPYQVESKFHSAVVLLKPAKGGVKAGGAVRVVADMGGVRNVSSKILSRSPNKLNNARAAIEAFSRLRNNAR